VGLGGSSIRLALHSSFQKTAGYPEGAGSSRSVAQPGIVLRRQIQQPPLREVIGFFSEAAAPICLLFQKRTVHFGTPNTTNDLTSHGLLGFLASAPKLSPTIVRSAKSGGEKQFVGGLVQTLFGRVCVREVPDELSGQFVNVGAPKIVKLLTLKTENTGPPDRRDVDALAAENVSVHGNPISPSPSTGLRQTRIPA
jgi:hypothetical protein